MKLIRGLAHKSAGEGDEPRPALPAAIAAMLAALEPAAREEVRRALHHDLFPRQSPAERREQELAPLSRLLRTHGVWPAELPANADEVFPETRAVRRAGSPRERWPVIERTLYDQLRPPGAPSSKTLMTRHRAPWPMVCRAAAALPLYGTVLGPGDPWQNPARGGPGTRSRPPYTSGDCIDAVFRCAAARGKDPRTITSTAYLEWARGERARARMLAPNTPEGLGAADPRLPSWDAFARCFPRQTWQSVMRAVRRECREREAQATEE